MDAVGTLLDGDDLAASTHRAAGVLDAVTQPAGHRPVVDDRGRGGVQRGHPAGVRFVAAQVVPVQHGGVRDAVGLCPARDVGEPAQLAVVDRDHDLAALVVADAVRGAVLFE